MPKIERMEAKKDKKQKSLILKLLEDRKAINECIRKGDDLQKLAEERDL
jgi:Tfp pilus assembly ATPase PilU